MADQSNTYGSAERQVTADPAARLGSGIQTAQVQEGGVSAPMTPDLSKVSQNAETISNLLGTASNVAQEYFDKKKDQWNIEGQMAYAQGKTQQDIQDSGNAYTMAGFMSMKVRTASNEWYAKAQDDITHKDLELDPKAYAKKLSDGFQQLQDSVGNAQDPYTKTLLTSLASQNLPKLAEQQVHANNEFKHVQTINNYTGMLISESSRNDPNETPDQKQQRLLSLTSPAISGLNTDDHKNAVSTAIYQSLVQGNNSLVSAVGFHEAPAIQAMNLGGNNPVLTNAVQHVDSLNKLTYAVENEESHHNPNAVGKYIPGQGSAQGSMQTMPATLKDPGFGVTPAKDNSPAEMARVGRDYLEAMVKKFPNQATALAAYNWGVGNVEKLLAKNVAPGSPQFIAALPAETQNYIKAIAAKMDVPPGQPSASTGVRYSGETQVASNSPGIQNFEQAKIQGGASFNAAIARSQGGGVSMQTLPMDVATQNINDKQAMMTALTNAGYTPAQVDKVASGYTQYQDSKDKAYNASRTEFEAQAVNNVALDGNIPKYLESVEGVANKLGLGDTWKAEMAQRGVSAWEAGRNQRTEMQIIGTAITGNRMNTLAPDQQSKGMELQRATIAGQVAQDQSIPQDQKGVVAANKYMDWLGAQGNKLVDTTLGTSIANSLSGNILDKEGKNVSPEAVEAYRQYTYLSDKFTPGYAQSMLPDSIKPLINQAEAMSSGRQDIGSALLSAYNTINKKDSGQENIIVPDKEAISTAVSAKVALAAPSVLAAMGADKEDAMGYFDVTSSDVDKAKVNSALTSVATINAKALANSPSAANMSPEAIAGQAVADTMNRGARVQGNWLQAAKDSTIMKDMGVNDTRKNAAEFAILNYAKIAGNKMFVPPRAIGESQDTYQKRLDAGSAEWNNSINLSSMFTKNRDAYGNVKYFVGNANLGIPDGFGIHPAAMLHGLPRMNISYDPVMKAVTYQRYAYPDSDVLAGNPVTVPMRLIGQVHQKYMAENPVSSLNIADKAANVVSALSPSNDAEPK